MTASVSMQNTDHLAQICKERSARGVATRADWQRLADISPDLAYRELKSYLQTTTSSTYLNPYDQEHRPRFFGMASGFILGVILMAVWWYIADYLQREVIDSARHWDLLTFSQYAMASLLPFFGWLGWRLDKRRAIADLESADAASKSSLQDATWDELLNQFDATRKAGGTRMY